MQCTDERMTQFFDLFYRLRQIYYLRFTVLCVKVLRVKLISRSGGQDGRLDRYPTVLLGKSRFINLCKQLVLLNTYHVSMFTRHKRQGNSVQSKPSLKRYKRK